jgi:hypothetical protein
VGEAKEEMEEERTKKKRKKKMKKDLIDNEDRAVDQAVIRHISTWKIGVDSRPVAVGFMVNEITLRQIFSKFFGFTQSLSFHICAILIFLCNSLMRSTSGRNAGAFELSNALSGIDDRNKQRKC